MSFVVRSLASGSSGNALVVETARRTVLVDCGLAANALARAVAAGGRSVETVAAVLVSHEHVDHVRGLQLLVKGGVPIVATAGTHRMLDAGAARFRSLEPGRPHELDGDLVVHGLAVAHDAAEPCGFCLEIDGRRLTVITDLGTADDRLCAWIASSELIIIEANHDEEMVRRGPYPTHLKRRVLSATGHLSNADCGRLLQMALVGSEQPRTIWLAHLSAVNNRPDLAVSTVVTALTGTGAGHAVRALPRKGEPIVWRSDTPFASPAKPVQLALFGPWA
jgi:phosphoribosyl 1,2-cyclic phosphodiesterase